MELREVSLSTSPRRSPISDVPPRVMNRVFSFLEPRELAICQQVCDKWERNGGRPHLWHDHCVEALPASEYRETAMKAREKGIEPNWKEAYVRNLPSIKERSAVRRQIIRNSRSTRVRTRDEHDALRFVRLLIGAYCLLAAVALFSLVFSPATEKVGFSVIFGMYTYCLFVSLVVLPFSPSLSITSHMPLSLTHSHTFLIHPSCSSPTPSLPTSGHLLGRNPLDSLALYSSNRLNKSI